MWSVDSYSRDETLNLGAVLGRFVPAGTTFALRGDLGAGKTLFTQGLALGLEIGEPVTSPTFTIVNQYVGGRLPLNHMDIYRINTEDELYEIGIEEYFDGEAVCVAEWPDMLGGLLPETAINIDFRKHYDDDGLEWRQIEINADPADCKWIEEAMEAYAYTVS